MAKRCMWTTALSSTTDGFAYLTVQVSALIIIFCTCKCSSTRYLPSIYTQSPRLALEPWALSALHQIARRSQLLMRMNRLEVEDLTPAPSMTVPLEHSSRPTLGFPLGTALLLLVIFSLSGLFSCCYHWDRLRALLRSRHPAMFQEGEHTVISIAPSPSKAASDQKVEKVGKECGLPVIMPGDKVPKFFARPCPHETCLPEAEEKSSEVPSGANKCSVQENVSICIHESSTVSC